MKTFFRTKKEALKSITQEKILYHHLKIKYNFHKHLKELVSTGAEGIGVVEVILILVVLIGLVIIFKDQLTSIVNSLFKNIKSDIRGI